MNPILDALVIEICNYYTSWVHFVTFIFLENPAFKPKIKFYFKDGAHSHPLSKIVHNLKEFALGNISKEITVKL